MLEVAYRARTNVSLNSRTDHMVQYNRLDLNSTCRLSSVPLLVMYGNVNEWRSVVGESSRAANVECVALTATAAACSKIVAQANTSFSGGSTGEAIKRGERNTERGDIDDGNALEARRMNVAE